jgi:hypothetical protein
VDLQQRQSAAAAMLRECREALAARGSTVIREAAGGGDGAAAITDWRHYPEGDVYDPAARGRAQ